MRKNNILKSSPPIFSIVVYTLGLVSIAFIIIHLMLNFNLLITSIVILLVIYLFSVQSFKSVELNTDSIRLFYWLKIYHREETYNGIKILKAILRKGGKVPASLLIYFSCDGKQLKKRIYLTDFSNSNIEEVLQKLEKLHVNVIDRSG